MWFRSLLIVSTVLTTSTFAQDFGLKGRVENGIYISSTGEFKITSPVLPELGGTVTDTENVVTFSDDYGTHISIGCFPMDATQRWELATRDLNDYLLYFFTDIVLADFQQRFPESKIESARFISDLLGGTLIAYSLLPGGSSFESAGSLFGDSSVDPVVAKRGNLLFLRNQHIYIISTELAERAIQRSTYNQTTEQEDALLSTRLIELANRLVFTNPRTNP